MCGFGRWSGREDIGPSRSGVSDAGYAEGALVWGLFCELGLIS